MGVVYSLMHQRMLVDIIQTGNLLDYKVSEMLKEFNLTHIQFNILKILLGSRPEPLSVGELKERIVFSNCDITRLLDRLVDKTLVLRESASDNRRKVNILITDKGVGLLDNIEPQLVKALNNFYINDISAEEARAVSESLVKIRS